MQIKVQATEKLTSGQMQRLTNSLSHDLETHPLQIFNIIHPNNCCLLKLVPIASREDITVQHVLTAATVHLFALAVEDDHRGWFFLLPQHGNMFATPSGMVYSKPDMARLKDSFGRKTRVVDNDVKALDPEIYLPHSDFSICGLDNGSILLIARNTTHVITQ